MQQLGQSVDVCLSSGRIEDDGSPTIEGEYRDLHILGRHVEGVEHREHRLDESQRLTTFRSGARTVML